jgi:hypothetical protein
MQPHTTTPVPDEPQASGPSHRPAATVALAIGLGLMAAVAGWWLQASRIPDPVFAYGMKLAVPRTIHPVTLTSLTGPDVCPMTMQYLRQEVQAMGGRAARLHVTFVSVDPARDTPAALARFVHYYDPAFEGVTGPKAALDQLTADAGAAYFKGAKAGRSATDYAVTHSTSIYVIHPSGKLVAIYGGSGTPGRMARDFAFLGNGTVASGDL